MDEKEIGVFLLSTTTVVLILLLSFFYVFFSYKNRRKLYQLEKQKLQEDFEKNMLLAEAETKDNIMQQIGTELHDTVGQKLTLAYLQMQNLTYETENPKMKDALVNHSEILQSSLQEIRSLSKLLNSDTVTFNGFAKSVAIEMKRIDALGVCKTSFEAIGERYQFKNPKADFIMLGLIREFIQNSLKHSQANIIGVHIKNENKNLTVFCFDDGLGMTGETKNDGQGISNINSRATLLNATTKWGNYGGKGTTLTLEIN